MSTKTALLDSLMEKYGYDAIAMIPSPNMSWLTGQAKSQGERPTTIIYRPGKTAALIIAGFEVDAAPAMKPARHTYLHAEKYRERAKEVLLTDPDLRKVFHLTD